MSVPDPLQCRHSQGQSQGNLRGIKIVGSSRVDTRAGRCYNEIDGSAMQLSPREEVKTMQEWIAPDFEEIEVNAECSAYAGNR